MNKLNSSPESTIYGRICGSCPGAKNKQLIQFQGLGEQKELQKGTASEGVALLGVLVGVWTAGAEKGSQFFIFSVDAVINHYNRFIVIRVQFEMQNISNMSFFYVANPLHYYTYVPITPSFSDVSSPISDNYIASPNTIMFPTNVDSLYYPQQYNPCTVERVRVGNQEVAVKNEMGPTDQASKQNIPDQKRLTMMPTVQSLKESLLKSPKREEQSLGYVLEKAQQKLKREGKKNSKMEIDQDYLPELDRNRKYSLKYQVNENRNVIPNQINQIFSFVQKMNKSGQLVAKLFQKYQHPPEYTIKRFYLYQALLKNRLGHYTNERSLKVVSELYEPKCENWTEQEQRYYNKICRVLIHHFLYEDSIFIILTSKRMKSEKKRDHLTARRKIAESVSHILKGF